MTCILIGLQIWSYQARNATYRSVRNAVLQSGQKFVDSFARLENIIMVKEPEAAALYVVRLKNELNEAFLKVSVISRGCLVKCLTS